MIICSSNRCHVGRDESVTIWKCTLLIVMQNGVCAGSLASIRFGCVWWEGMNEISRGSRYKTIFIKFSHFPPLVVLYLTFPLYAVPLSLPTTWQAIIYYKKTVHLLFPSFSFTLDRDCVPCGGIGKCTITIHTCVCERFLTLLAIYQMNINIYPTMCSLTHPSTLYAHLFRSIKCSFFLSALFPSFYCLGLLSCHLACPNSLFILHTGRGWSL